MHITSDRFVEVGLVGVLVNNKRVPRPVEVNTEEGWVKALVPKLPPVQEAQPPDFTRLNTQAEQSDPDTGESDWEEKTLYGKVTLVLTKQ